MKLSRKSRAIAMNLLAILVGSSAQAAPTLFPVKPNELRGIRNETNSTVLGDTVDPSAAWVLPPRAGIVKATSFQARSANLGFCREMADLQGYMRNLSASIERRTREYEEDLPELQKKREKYLKLKAAAAEIVTSNRDLQKIVEVDARILAIETRLEEMFTRSEGCSPLDSALCEALDREISDLQKERATLVTDNNQLKRQVREEYKKYERARSVADVAKEGYDGMMDDLSLKIGVVNKARAEVFKTYEHLGRLEGGFSSLVYDSGWEANIARLQSANPGFLFKEVPTRQAQVNASLVPSSDRDAYLSSLPMVLDYNINGQSFAPWMPGAQQALPQFPGKMSATLRLSLIGACPAVHPELFDLKRDEQGLPLFGLATGYEFQSAFHTRVKFSFNLVKIYELIKSSGTDGGFFSTSSWSRTSETNSSDSSFSVDWKDSDPEGADSEEKRQAIIKEIKSELMNRVLKEMAMPVVDGPARAEAAPPVPQSGALVLAQGLEQSCGWYSYYCTGGSWLLRGLQAVFGSSSSEQSFRTQHQGGATEEWSIEKVRWKPAITAFAQE